MFTFINTKGYSLVEVLVAVAILMLAIVGPMTIAMKSIQSAQYVHQQNTAVFLAQEGASFISAIRDDAALSYYNGSTDNPWLWASSTEYVSCFAATGCNMDASGTAVPCDESGDSCVLYFDESSGRSKYHTGGVDGLQSIYVRRIILTSNGDEVQAEVRVEWQTKLLDGTQAAIVTTSFFNAYK